MIAKTLVERTRNEMEENFVGKKTKAQEKQALRFHFQTMHISIELYIVRKSSLSLFRCYSHYLLNYYFQNRN